MACKLCLTTYEVQMAYKRRAGVLIRCLSGVQQTSYGCFDGVLLWFVNVSYRRL
jgi:hypothetical protein